MREATYEDAVSIGRLLNVHRDEVWKILKGLRYSSESELSLAVHNAFKMNTTPDLVIKDPDRKGTAAGPSSRNDS